MPFIVGNITKDNKIMKQSNERVWLTADGKLVKDGHEDASTLFAAKGQLVPDSYIEGIDGAGEFFSDANKPHPEPAQITPKPFKMDPGQTNVGKKKSSKVESSDTTVKVKK